MPIYSTNRVSSASPRRIVAAEGYTDHDFGRILSETYANDMKVFNVGLARDFQEATAINENTMVSSELRALQEFSIKEAFKSLKEKVKKLWAKIKGVFRNVYAKLSVWINRSNKLYVAQNRKYLEKKKNLGACKLPKFHKINDSVIDEVNKDIGRLAGWVDRAKSRWDANKDTGRVHNLNDENDGGSLTALAKGVTSDGYQKAMEEKMFAKPNDNLTFANCGLTLTDLFDGLTNSSKALKDLKKSNKNMDTAFKKMISAIDSAANGKEVSEMDKNIYNAYSKWVTKFQTAAQVLAKTAVSLTKKKYSEYRGVIAALVAYDPDKPLNDNAMFVEFSYLSGLNMLTEETEDMTDEDLEDAAQGGDGEVSINIEIDGTADADVNVEDNTGDDD